MTPAKLASYYQPRPYLLRVPQRPKKYFLLEWPGEASSELVAQYPFLDHRVTDECDNVVGAIKNTLWLLKQGQPARLVLPFYMAKRYMLPNHRKFCTDMPMLPFGMPDLTYSFPNAVGTPGAWLRELTNHCKDAHGRVYPELWTRAILSMAEGEALVPAVGRAFRETQPALTQALHQFTTRGNLLSRSSLVRDFETTLAPGTQTPYFKTGRKALDFFCDYGALAREGSGRVRWSNLFATAFLSLDSKP